MRGILVVVTLTLTLFVGTLHGASLSGSEKKELTEVLQKLSNELNALRHKHDQQHLKPPPHKQGDDDTSEPEDELTQAAGAVKQPQDTADTADTDTEDHDTGNTDTEDHDTGNTDNGNTDTEDHDTGNNDTGDSDTGDSDTGKPDVEEEEEDNTVETDAGASQHHSNTEAAEETTADDSGDDDEDDEDDLAQDLVALMEQRRQVEVETRGLFDKVKARLKCGGIEQKCGIIKFRKCCDGFKCTSAWSGTCALDI